MNNKDKLDKQERLKVLSQDILAVRGQPGAQQPTTRPAPAPASPPPPPQHPTGGSQPAMQSSPHPQQYATAPARSAVIPVLATIAVMILLSTMGMLGYYVFDLRAQVAEIQGGNPDLEAITSEMEDRIAKLEAQLDEASSEAGASQTSLLTINTKLRKLSARLSGLEATVEEMPDDGNLKGTISANSKAIEQLKNSQASIRNLEGQLAVIKNDLDTISASQGSLGKSQEKLNTIERSMQKHNNDIRQIYRLIESMQ